MRAAIYALLSAVLLVSVADGSQAASSREKQKQRRNSYSRPYTPSLVVSPEQKRRNLRAYERGEYYERDSNALPVGSKAWFEQKEREDGCC